MLNFNNFEYAKWKLPANDKEKNAVLEDLKQKFINEVKGSERCRNYFSKYDPDSIEEFILYYAKAKIDLLGSFDYYMRIYNENVNEEYLQNARFVLNCILQKKLFNLQLQWRAEQIKIDGIQTTYDFNFWERNIEHCPFIPPITSDELEHMKKFLRQNYFRNLKENEYWQFYTQIMGQDEDDDFLDMPEWYEFYDNMFGTGQLLHLPDIRGEKEEFYSKIVRDAEMRESEEQSKNKPPQPPYLPKFYLWYKETFDFALQCESDQYFKELFKISYKNMHPDYNDEEYEQELVEKAIEILEDADRPVMLSPNLVWHKAIIDGADRYITDKTLEALNAVYDEYMILIDIGISNRFTPEEEDEERKQDHFRFFTERLLKGRELNGEPRNFDF